MSVNHSEISSFIWNVCDDVLRGLFKPHEYGDIILPFTPPVNLCLKHTLDKIQTQLTKRIQIIY